MILRAIIDHELKTFELREGMAFGSDPSCDVVVPHARDRQAFLCVDAEGVYLEAFAAPDVEAGRFPLEIGSVFAIGQTIFDCIEAPVLPRVQEKPVEPIRRACPRCRASLLSVDLSAKFCPQWQPRFFVFPGTRDAVRVGVAALEAEAFLVWPRLELRRFARRLRLPGARRRLRRRARARAATRIR